MSLPRRKVLSRKVQKTLAYSNFFKFPLFRHEICYWLISKSRVRFSRLLPFLPPEIAQSDRLKRQTLKQISEEKIKRARELSRILSLIPTVNFIGITGSVAVANAKREDDIDLLIITASHTLWLTRPLVLILTQLLFKRRFQGQDPKTTQDSFCLNLWLDELGLAIPSSKQNLYTAHEVLQILPIYDRSRIYLRMLLLNSWIKKFLANAYLQKIKSRAKIWTPLPFYIIFSPLNYLFYLAQLIYMSSRKTVESVSYHQAFFHLVNYHRQITQHLKTA